MALTEELALKLRVAVTAACAERDARIANIERALEKAERTLTAAGYTDEGGELWKPPIGPSPSPLLDRIEHLEATASANYGRGQADAHSMLTERIAELERQLAEARKDAERIDWLSSSKSSHGFCHTMYGEYLFYAHQLDGFPTVREAIDNAMQKG